MYFTNFNKKKSVTFFCFLTLSECLNATSLYGCTPSPFFKEPASKNFINYLEFSFFECIEF